jgi:hypothetical protein
MRAQPKLCVAAAASLLSLLASCESSPWYEHRFQPAPLEAEVSTQAVPGSQMRALVTVLGIEKGKDGKKDRALVRMRLENIGTSPAGFDSAASSLVTADLKSFGPPATTPVGKDAIPPGSNGEYDVEFPLPEGKGPYDLDLSGLNLRFTVVFGETKVTTGMTFQRADWRYLEPGYPRWQVGVGVGWTRFN